MYNNTCNNCYVKVINYRHTSHVQFLLTINNDNIVMHVPWERNEVDML